MLFVPAEGKLVDGAGKNPGRCAPAVLGLGKDCGVRESGESVDALFAESFDALSGDSVAARYLAMIEEGED